MPQDNTATPSGRILIVDDDMMMRERMKDALARDDYIIEEVDNGLDALAAVRNSEPDMILLDLKMPGMSGFEVCSEIRSNLDMQEISVVMVTGQKDSESIEKAYNLGATAFINKPINSITFRYQIQYLLKARNAFVELKEREIHLEYMERISRILAQSKNHDANLQEALDGMLDIFSADRVFIISSLDAAYSEPEASYEALRTGYTSIRGKESTFINEMEPGLLRQAETSEFPVVTSSPDSSLGSFQVYNQMMKSLHFRDDQIWLLVIQQCTSARPWSGLLQEIFLCISTLMDNLLSRYLLMGSLRRSENLLRHAQRLGHLGNWSLNLKTNKLSWSDEMYRISGYEPGNIKPTRDEFFKVEFEEDNARLEQIEPSLLKADGNYSIERRIRLPNNEIRWVHEQVVGRFDDQGKLIEVNATVQDITDRIRQKEQEVHVQEMEAVGQLTSGIAHDFGNLMEIADGNLQLLSESFVEQYGIDSESMDILDDARSAIHDSVELTKQLLASARRKSIAPAYLNIRDTIFNSSKLLKNVLGDKIELSINIENDLPDILVDSAQFERSLLNVVLNARDAMPDGGILSIDAQVINSRYGPPNLSAESGSTDRYVHIYIADSGTGMNSGVLRLAPEPFFTTKKDAGTGLGLSMVCGFMHQSMGELGIESEPGQGTRIIMQFPV